MARSHLIAVGASFKTAPLAVRERLAIGMAAAPEALHGLREYAAEALILSTCNRTELYLVASDVKQALYGARHFFSARSGLPAEDLDDKVYGLADDAAALHFIEVAAGMDSLVPGEHEILAQVRLACQVAQETRTLGPVLSRLCQTALHAGKRARSETAIGRHAASVSLAAVRLAQEVLGTLHGRAALIVGAGKTANLVTQALRGQQLAQVHIASRRLDQAEELAARAGGQAWDMAALSQLLPTVDLLISCTSAADLVVTAPAVAEALRSRAARPLLLIDLAVPRDIDPQVRELPGVALYDIDDLRAICERNQAARKRALGQVGAIVQEEAEDFRSWWRARDASTSVALLRAWAEEVRKGEIAKTMGKLPHLAEGELQALDALTQAIIGKLLHRPTLYLKSRDGVHASQVIHDMFGITLPGSGLKEMEEMVFGGEGVKHG